jgi:hypothetical protein
VAIQAVWQFRRRPGVFASLVHWQNSINVRVHGHSHARTLLATTKKRTLSPTSRYPCPLRDQYQCALTFSTKWVAQNHAAQHSGIRHPCTVADHYQCSQTFADVASARLHAQSQHLRIRFPCPLADRFQCFSQTFPSQKHARLHAESQHLQNSISLHFSGLIPLLPNLHSEMWCTRACSIEARGRRLSLSFGRTVSIFPNIPQRIRRSQSY